MSDLILPGGKPELLGEAAGGGTPAAKRIRGVAHSAPRRPRSAARWRLYDPLFQAALNGRQAEVWAAGIDRLRSLVPKALGRPRRGTGGQGQPQPGEGRRRRAPTGPVPGAIPERRPDPGEIVRQVVEERRKQARDPLEDMLEGTRGLPPLERHLEETSADLEGQAGVADGE
jgi:hypothetical protein